MTKHLITAATLLALGSSGAFAMGHAGNTGYALAGDGGTLVVMADIAAPDMIETFALETPVDAIAYRP